MKNLIINLFLLFVPVVSHGGCFISKNGQALLIQQTTGLWALPGGHTKGSETPRETAARETHEETGYRVNVNEHLWK